MKRLRPAFVITLVTAACASPPATQPDDGPGHNPPQPLRKREGKTTVLQAYESPAEIQGEVVSMHPKDGQGRTIYVSDDNSCFIETPREDDPPRRVDRWVNSVPVDCPVIFDDPAWDDLRSSWELKMDVKTHQCLFDHIGGNPPPADVKATCPGQPPAAPTEGEPAK